MDTTRSQPTGGNLPLSSSHPKKFSSPPSTGTSGSGMPRRSPRTNLTDRKLDDYAKKRLTKDIDISDTSQKGLVARVRVNGTRAFYFKWRPKRLPGHPRKWRSIRLDAAGVEEARQKASEAAAQVAIGRDPKVTAAAYSPASAITVEAAVKDFVAYLKKKGNTPDYVKNVEAMFRNHVEPTLGKHRVIDLTQRDFARFFSSLMDKVSAKAGGEAVDGGAPTGTAQKHKRPVDSTKRKVTVLPNRVYTQVHNMLRWATEEGILPPGAAPVLRRPISVEPSKARLDAGTKRILRVGHFARIWLAVEDEPTHIRVLVRLLLLLPFRREEITGLLWPEVKGIEPDATVVSFDPNAYAGPRLDIPAHRMKGKKRPQLMPLPDSAVEMLREMHEQRGADGPCAFSVTAGRTSFGGWQSLLARLRRRCTDMPEGWHIHDLRTGFATEAGDRLDAEPSVVARLLAHSLEARLGVTWRYDQSRRVAPMLSVLRAWERLLLDAVEAERRRRDAAASTDHVEPVVILRRAVD